MYKNISSIMGSGVVSRFVNISVAKRISCVLVVVVLIANTIEYLESGMDSCRGLLESGRLLDKEVGVWQPVGCMLHKYKTRESQGCLQKKEVAFVGDSRMRYLMFSISQMLNPDYEPPKGEIHSDISVDIKGINLNFYWVPVLNATAMNLLSTWKTNPVLRPDIVFQSAGLHTIKLSNASTRGLNEYSQNFTKLAKELRYFSEEYNAAVFWILIEPVYESKLNSARKMIKNEIINKYNEEALEALSKEDPKKEISIIESFKWISSQLIDLSEDGLHVPPQATSIQSSIILNRLCNDKLRPVDGTCCQSSPAITAVQVLLLLMGISCISGTVVMLFLNRKFSKRNHPDIEVGGNEIVQNGTAESAEKLLQNDKTEVKPTNSLEKTRFDVMMELLLVLSKYSFIMLYFYICDRTNLLMKGNKHFSNAMFFLPLLYVSLLGLFGIIQTSQTALLNRDQTDEWKGWMQLIILIYHMSGASVNVPIYMHIRMLVAMYLFMTGYGHFSYFWNKGDYSLHRVLNVVFRLNFLTVSLCLVMDRSYQFYYFVPLCTFWYLILYISMAVWPRANVKMMNATAIGTTPSTSVTSAEKDYPLRSVNLKSPYAIMIFKLTLLLITISVIFVSESYFEAMFSWWPAIRLFELPIGSVREWWFRCQLDRYAMLHGAVLCFIYLIMKKLSILDDSKQGCLFSTKTSFITMTMSIGIIICYVVWVVHCTDKVACNKIHSYASILPITAFIIIRNVPGYLRSGYSAFFAWFGKISLELFIGQYHIWLAADTKGMLIVVSTEWPLLNLVITSFIFVCVAHEINQITGIVTKHFIGTPKDDVMKVGIRFAVLVSSICAISFIQNTFNPPIVGT